MKNLNDRAMDIRGKVYIMRLAAQHTDGEAGNECQKFVANILPELIELEGRLEELAEALDEVEIAEALDKSRNRINQV